MTLDINKFSLAQALSDYSGKTSASALSGFIIVITGCISFLAGIYAYLTTKSTDVLTQSVFVIGLGAGVITGRKIVNGKEPSDNTETETTKVETTTVEQTKTT